MYGGQFDAKLGAGFAESSTRISVLYWRWSIFFIYWMMVRRHGHFRRLRERLTVGVINAYPRVRAIMSLGRRCRRGAWIAEPFVSKIEYQIIYVRVMVARWHIRSLTKRTSFMEKLRATLMYNIWRVNISGLSACGIKISTTCGYMRFSGYTSWELENALARIRFWKLNQTNIVG